MADPTDDLLVAELRTLGRTSAPTVDVDLLATRVAASLPTSHSSTRTPRLTRRRVVLAALAVLLALVATPPVRATVEEWFGFGGVRVEPGDSEGAPAPAPPIEGGGDLAEAAARVDFTVLAPRLLGPPDGVRVSHDGRVVSMSWTRDGAPVRVDQFDGTLDYAVAKQSPQMTFVTVAGSDALWFPVPHEIVLLDADGTRRTESARLAGQTLVWPVGRTTFRLEGELTLADAVEIAESAEPIG